MNKQSRDNLWLSFHGCPFAFPKETVMKIPYVASRVARWDGKQGFGQTLKKPIVFESVSLQAFLHVFTAIHEKRTLDPMYKEDARYMGLDVKDVDKPHYTDQRACGFIELNPFAINSVLEKNQKPDKTLVKTSPDMSQRRAEYYGLGAYFKPKKEKLLDSRTFCTTKGYRSEASIAFGKLLCVSIPSDPLEYQCVYRAMSMCFMLPALPLGYRWRSDFSVRLLESVVLLVGGNEVSTLTGQSNALLALAYGKPVFADTYYRNLDNDARAARSQRAWQIDLPLMFPMTRFRQAPLLACRLNTHKIIQVNTHKIQVKIRIASLYQLIERTETPTDCRELVDVDLEDMILCVEQVNLTDKFIKDIQKNPNAHITLFHQLQNCCPEAFCYSPSSQKSKNVLLRFRNPCTGLLIMFEYEKGEKDDSIPEREWHDPCFHPFTQCILKIKNKPILYNTAARMRTTEWQRCGIPIPNGHQWYLLPFGESMFEYWPQNMLDFSAHDDITLDLTPNNTVLRRYPTWYMHIAALTLNQCLTTYGMLGLRWWT